MLKYKLPLIVIVAAHAIFTMRSVVENYCKSGSTVTVFALDISKAFDRVNNYALLSLLIDRKVPKYYYFLSQSCLNGFSIVLPQYAGEVLYLLLLTFWLE